MHNFISQRINIIKKMGTMHNCTQLQYCIQFANVHRLAMNVHIQPVLPYFLFSNIDIADHIHQRNVGEDVGFTL